MRKLTVFVVAALVCMVVGGCKRDHEAVMKDSLACMNELVDALKNVKDEASAKAAASKIEAIAERMKKLKEEADKMPKPSTSEDQQLKEKYEKEMKQVQASLMSEAMRIGMNPKLAAARDILSKIGEKMQ